MNLIQAKSWIPGVLLCGVTIESDDLERFECHPPGLALPRWVCAPFGSIPQLGYRDARHGNVVGALPLEVCTDTRRAAAHRVNQDVGIE